MIRSIIAVFMVLVPFSLFAQNEDDGELTPPLLLKSHLPAKESLLVYPDELPPGFALSRQVRAETPKISRRYIETPTPDDIPADSLIRTVSGDIGGGGPTILANDSITAPRVTDDSEDVPAPLNPSRPRPVADPNSQHPSDDDPHHPPVRTASFQGVVPGESSLADVAEKWGHPRKATVVNGQTAHLYSTEVLNHIEVFFKEDVVSSIVIRLDEPFPERLVRDVLKSELQETRPVMIPNEFGEIIGEVFPEKGVLFLFAPQEEDGLFVKQIGIEPVTSEPFVLRAEATLNDQPSEAKRDLLDAVRLNPDDAKARWLLARIMLMEGNIEGAMLHCERAIRLDDRRPAYHILFARILTKMNRCEEAKQYLEDLLEISDRVPHEKAMALSLLGDLYRTSTNPDYELAISFHSDAIRLASTLTEHPNQTIRLAAKDVLFEAHLGAARDVAWGRWDGKEESIAKWIDRAREIATDPEMLAARRYSQEYPFKIAVCALAVQVGLSEAKDIEPFIRDVINAGRQLIRSTRDTILQRKYQWETSLSLYDAVQIYQLRKRYTPALKYGEIAADYMELGIKERRSDTDLYLLGRLYFRLGAIHAIGNKNHRAAIEWYDRAKPIFEVLQGKINVEELGRLGETFVSMGVSYWMTEQREEAVRLTEQGRDLIERGVRAEAIDEKALEIPHLNLANMYKELRR